MNKASINVDEELKRLSEQRAVINRRIGELIDVKRRDRDFFKQATDQWHEVEEFIPEADEHFAVTIISNREGHQIYLYPQPSLKVAASIEEQRYEWNTDGKYWTTIRHSVAQSDVHGIINMQLDVNDWDV